MGKTIYAENYLVDFDLMPVIKSIKQITFKAIHVSIFIKILAGGPRCIRYTIQR